MTVMVSDVDAKAKLVKKDSNEKIKKLMKAIHKSPFADNKGIKEYLKQGAVSSKVPARYPKKRPVEVVEQTIRPDYTIHPHYVLPPQ
jgi:hypothetical protein